jgi:hypothetical protein
MEPRARRIVQILESEIGAICRDAGIACDDYDSLLERLEADDDTLRHLSAPVADALRSLLALRHDMLGIHVHPS